MKKLLLLAMAMVLVLSIASVGLAAKNVRIMVEVSDFDDAVINQLKGNAVNINYEFPEIKTVALTVKDADIPTIQSLPGVVGVYRDNEVTVHDGLMTWDLDMIDVEKLHNQTTIDVDGSGVYVAVLDTGLLPHWKNYFPEERIATELGAGFLNPNGNINPGAWTGIHGHGTHVTSTILGYNLYTTPINGVAPGAKVIPVKVLSNQGSGYDAAVTAGILYVANLKASGRVVEPIVINMSLGSRSTSVPELNAIRYAIEQGVIVVASAGNEGETGMGYPGGYDEVISVGATGWTGTWVYGWRGDVPEGDIAEQVYVAEFSSRELPGQYLDVLAPGAWVVGPYSSYGAAHPPRWAKQDKIGQYYYLSGTSMAAPHVAGVAALMLEKNPALTQRDVEKILKETTLYIPPNAGLFVPLPGGGEVFSWGADAIGSGLIQADAAVEAAGSY